jgi:hypothetical protein
MADEQGAHVSTRLIVKSIALPSTQLSLGGFKRQGSFPSNLLASQTPILAQLKRFGLGNAVL